LLDKADHLILKFEKFIAKWSTTKPKKEEYSDFFTVYKIYTEIILQQIE